MSKLERIPIPEVAPIRPTVVKPFNHVAYRPKSTSEDNIRLINARFYNRVTNGLSILIQRGRS